jgi:NAD(P)-dependent dehydrogenase (short-subunit alcohol dehydrogenase family)
VLVRGDLSEPEHCRDVIARAVDEFGRVDVLVSNAAYQMTHESLEDIPDDEWGYTFRTNVEAHVPPRARRRSRTCGRARRSSAAPR